jgi:hypothetical protein
VALNPDAKNNLNPLTIALGENEVEKTVTITNNGPYHVFEPLTQTELESGESAMVLVQGDIFRAGVVANLAGIEALADADLLGVVVANPVIPSPDVWTNASVSAGVIAVIDGASVAITGTGSGGRASFNAGKTSGKWALNVSITYLDASAFEAAQVGFAHASADDSDLSAVTEVAVASLYLTYVGVARLGAPSVQTGAVLDTKTLPSSLNIAVFVDIDAGTWGVVDDEGTAYTDVGALTNAEGVSPATVGGIESGIKLYPLIGAMNLAMDPDFSITYELLDANIPGVPEGYLALTAPMPE